MKLTHRVKGWWQNIWRPVGGSLNKSYDVFQGLPEPTPYDLIAACEETVFACASLISNTISGIDLKLCTHTRSPQTRRLPRKLAKAIRGRHKEEPLELLDHRLLDLLVHCNNEHSYADLMRLTVMYLEIVGHAFWYICFDHMGWPAELYLLPSQGVEIIKDNEGNVKGYRLNTQAQSEEPYPPERIIHFRHPDLNDPYSGGYPPLRAVWQAVQLVRKETSSWEAIVGNMAKPSMVVSPPEGETYSQSAAERIGKQLTQLFRTHENGGVLVVGDAMKVTPLGWAPKDLAGLTLAQDVRLRVCNVYQVPSTLIFMSEANLASAEAGERALMRDCIKPRMGMILRTLNARLVPLFDSEIFFATDELIPEDKTYLLQEKTYELSRDVAMIQNQSLTPNEWRASAELPPIPGGNRPLANPLALPPVQPPTQSPEAVHEQTNPPEQADVPVTSDLRSTVGGLQAIAGLQEAFYSGTLPRQAAVANVMLLFGFSQQEAESLFPEVAPVKLTPDEPAAQPQPVKSVRKKRKADRSAEEALSQVLLGYMRSQRAYCLTAITKHVDWALAKSLPGESDRSLPWSEWKIAKALPEVVDLSQYDAEMVRDCLPILRASYEAASNALTQKLGFDPELPKLLRANLSKAVEQQAIAFCAETNATTSLLVEDAISRTKDALKEGESEALSLLHERIAEIFDHAEGERIYTIAQTEQLRATENANLITAQESGVEVEKVWLADAQACDFCQRINGSRKALDQPFAIRGENPIYSTIHAPPGHPRCRCTCLYEPKE